MDIIYDCEVYPNVFTLTMVVADSPVVSWQFEISPWRDDSAAMYEWLISLKYGGHRMVGFNNVGFDYPLIHYFIEMQGKATMADLYDLSQRIFAARNNDDRFSFIVRPWEQHIPQVDLFKIHHFDNKAKMTSLKALEFNLRMDNISDLPFPPGTVLRREDVEVLKAYNTHDVEATLIFYNKSLPMIRFREELSKKYGKDFTNHNDTKIGSEVFQTALEAAGVQCYEGSRPRQTHRASIALRECIPSWVRFDNPEFERIRQHFLGAVITETKGAFKDLTASNGGLPFVFGTGGLHASAENEMFIADDEMVILDVDVTSMYPSIAISQGYYPEHLGPEFVKVYDDLRQQRIGYKKGSPENAMLKLALNGVYGKSNDRYSIFYDPKFTMSVTLTGQMALAMLAEKLAGISRIIQCNTDGITIHVPKSRIENVESLCRSWEKTTGLTLEEARYRRMWIADVNSYVAEGIDGKIKRKGRYEYDVEWHQNASALVVPKVAEEVLLKKFPVDRIPCLVATWPCQMDFMLRVKVPRSSRLEGDGQPLSNILRYYVAKDGVQLTKVMPPLAKKPDVWRRISVEAGWRVCPCNDMRDATLETDYTYYVAEVMKLVGPFMEKQK